MKKPKQGQRWTRRRTGQAVLVLAVTNPRGPTPAYVAIESEDLRASCVRYDRFARDYTGPL